MNKESREVFTWLQKAYEGSPIVQSLFYADANDPKTLFVIYAHSTEEAGFWLNLAKADVKFHSGVQGYHYPHEMIFPWDVEVRRWWLYLETKQEEE
jgi:hypothetical protein